MTTLISRQSLAVWLLHWLEVLIMSQAHVLTDPVRLGQERADATPSLPWRCRGPQRAPPGSRTRKPEPATGSLRLAVRFRPGLLSTLASITSSSRWYPLPLPRFVCTFVSFSAGAFLRGNRDQAPLTPPDLNHRKGLDSCITGKVGGRSQIL